MVAFVILKMMKNQVIAMRRLYENSRHEIVALLSAVGGSIVDDRCAANADALHAHPFPLRADAFPCPPGALPYPLAFEARVVKGDASAGSTGGKFHGPLLKKVKKKSPRTR